jgi:hypothetical protein
MDSRWHLFVYYAQEELGKQAFPLLDIEFSWDRMNPIIKDRGGILRKLGSALFISTLPVEGHPDRMRLDTGRTARGQGFGEKFNELAEALYQITQDIEGFAPTD